MKRKILSILVVCAMLLSLLPTMAFAAETGDTTTGTVTTDAPSTDDPSTDVPITDDPSTDAPSTDNPSTDAPSTDNPSTDAPSTDNPSTDAPSTDNPSTDAPSTDNPSTDAPSTDVPGTDEPITEDKEVIVDVAVTTDTDEDGAVVATIAVDPADVIAAMAGNEDKTVVLDASTATGATVASLGADVLKAIVDNTHVTADGEKAVEIKLPVGRVAMDYKLLNILIADLTATVKMGVQSKTATDIASDDSKTASQKNTIAADAGVKAILEIDLTVGGSKISNLGGGKMKVTVGKPAGIADVSFAYCLLTDGAKETTPCVIDGDDVTLTLSHLSTYVISTEDPATPAPEGGSGSGTVGGGSGSKGDKDPEKKPTVSFTDVAESAYYYDAVLWAVSKGITNGLTETTFVPNAACTRAQMVTFLWRAAGSPEPAGAVTFTDVAADAYYAKAIAWAAEQGITQGTSATTFSPNATVTRAQVVAFLYRADKADTAATSAFTDVPADAYYANAVAYAAQKGITDGVTATTFAPNSPCTRAQIVTFLFRDYAA